MGFIFRPFYGVKMKPNENHYIRDIVLTNQPRERRLKFVFGPYVPANLMDVFMTVFGACSQPSKSASHGNF